MIKDMANRHFIGEEDLIYLDLIGDQNGNTVKKIGEDIAALAQIQRAKGKQILILTSISKVGKTPLSSRTAGLETIKKMDFDKAAIWGSSIVAQEVANFVITASGRGFKIKLCSSEQEAKDWLTADL